MLIKSLVPPSNLIQQQVQNSFTTKERELSTTCSHCIEDLAVSRFKNKSKSSISKNKCRTETLFC